ncbi:hypothetical protein MBLNU459_g2797t1 [Dothideomycetes sp. NU459]
MGVIDSTTEKLILSTSNIIGAGGMDWPKNSNTELTDSLRTNFQETREQEYQAGAAHHYRSWTTRAEEQKTMYIPTLDFTYSALQEEREQYDITVKLFFLSEEDKSAREAHAREAIGLVLKELHVPNINLLIVSFPGVYFDEDSEDCPDKIKSRGPKQADPEPLDDQLDTWTLLEKLYDDGLVLRLGLSEFGAERLEPLLEKTRVKPTVDQINLRDCCSVPKPLSTLAKSRQIELLVHNDAPNILPRGTMQELLDERGADILGPPVEKLGAGHKRKRNEDLSNAGRMGGKIEPQWVVKYTAVVKNRGVVENKGYFACAKYTE